MAKPVHDSSSSRRRPRRCGTLPSDVEDKFRQAVSGAERIAVLAVGSTLRGDDAAGLLAAQALARHIGRKRTTPEIAIFQGETAPENQTGAIKRFRPTHLIILDAADLGREAGHIELIDSEAFSTNASFSTHSLPLKILVDYLRSFAPFEVIVIGIQPATTEFGQPPTPEVVQAARAVAAMVAACVAKGSKANSSIEGRTLRDGTP